MRVGVVFPGQGSQSVGMGADLVREFPAARALAHRANEILGFDLVKIMREGPESTLRETRYSQPAIFLMNILAYASLGDTFTPVVSAGHSFGEFCSLTIAGALDFDDALRLVNARGLSMQDAAERAAGAMTAILGLDAEPLAEAAARAREETRGRVSLANFNAPGQIVISGDADAVARAAQLATTAGAKRVVALNVSGAWHSELMEPARLAFAPMIEAAEIVMPEFTVISNVDAQPYRNVETIRRNLIASLTGEVRWHETATRLVEEEIDLVLELGSGAVLAPLFKRVPNAPKAVHAGDVAGVRKVAERLAGAAA